MPPKAPRERVPGQRAPGERTAQVMLRFTPAEAAEVKERAVAAGRHQVAAFAREQLLARLRQQPPQRAGADAVALAGWRYEVNQIGVNFNQALKLAHTWGNSGELMDGARGLWDALEAARVQLARLAERVDLT
jgi:hypothetical protein